MSLSDEAKIAIAKEYFRLADAGDPRLMELFHEDATIYFPKFGIGRGRTSLFDVVKGFENILEWIRHDQAALVFTPCGDRIAVEGISTGRMNGVTWTGGTTPGGRFCDVFEFRDERIARLHIYLDPDYLGEDNPRFLWGRTDREW